MKTLYVFGNVALQNDNFAHEVARHLGDVVTIEHCRSPDELLLVSDDELLILDVVKNITEPLLIEDPAQLKTRSLMSLHDFDLGFFLNLLAKMGKAKKVKIMGLPPQGDARTIAEKVKTWI